MLINRLHVKLLLAFLALTLAALVLSGLFINRAVNRQFRSYVEESREADNLRILDVVAAYYAERGTWRGVSPFLARVAMSTETLIVLHDAGGDLIYDSRLDMRGIMGVMGRAGMRQRVRIELEGESFAYPVRVEGRQVGTLTVTLLGREGILAQEDLDFSRAIHGSILLIAFLAGLGALGISLFLSRRLTRPLETVTAAVGRLKEGDLSQRVETPGRDELGQLAQAFNAMADRLQKNESLRRKLSADVSHELRTPLTALKGYLEAFKDGVLPPSQENITSLQEEVYRLENLVENLQHLALVENRALDMPQNPLDPAGTLRKIFDLYHPLMVQQGITPALDLQGKEAKAFLNEEALERILHNLLSNALKYTDEGGRIEVRLETGDSPPRLRIRVSDTGPGIRQEDLPHIFERFYRADPSRSRKTGGFGIGLTIVRELVEAQGGEIRAESVPEEGTSFTINFPALPR